MTKLEDNPTPLPPGIERPGTIGGEWFVAHAKPRMEKALAWDLVARGVAYYLPLVRRTYMSGGRRRTVLTPLFPSYVFIAGTPEDRLTALQTKRIVHVLPVPQQKQLASELNAIHAALSANIDLDVYPHVAVGRRVRVSRGPMRGVEGIVVRDENVARIVLQVTMIGSGASLEINAADLEESV